MAKALSLTCFDSGHQLDAVSFRAHLDRLASAGLDVIVAGEGSGELFTLSPTELAELLSVAVDELRGRASLTALGGCSRTASEQQTFIRIAERAGCQSVGLYPLAAVHNAKPDERQLEEYFNRALDHTTSSVVLSFYTPLHSYRISPALIGRLTERFENINEVQGGGTSDANDVTYLAQVLDAVRPGVGVYSAGPHHALTNLALGGIGFACGEANLVPRLAAQVITGYANGDLRGSQHAFGMIVRLKAILDRYGAVAATKALCAHWGLPVGPPRPPLLPLSEEARCHLFSEVESLNVQTVESELESAAQAA